jgi:hypothetical protein
MLATAEPIPPWLPPYTDARVKSHDGMRTFNIEMEANAPVAVNVLKPSNDTFIRLMDHCTLPRR